MEAPRWVGRLTAVLLVILVLQVGLIVVLRARRGGPPGPGMARVGERWVSAPPSGTPAPRVPPQVSPPPPKPPGPAPRTGRAEPGRETWEDRYSPPDRDSWQRPKEVFRALGIGAGSRVADVGCGYGYFTLRLARAVGPTGRVYARDIDPEAVKSLGVLARRQGLSQVDCRKSLSHDPLLPRGQVDVVLMVDTYHAVLYGGEKGDPGTSPEDYFRKNRVGEFLDGVRQALAPPGVLAVIDRDRPSPENLGVGLVSQEWVRRQVVSAGFQAPRSLDLLPNQYFLVFSVAPGTQKGR